MSEEYIKKQDAIDIVAFGITIATAINTYTGERVDLFTKENAELRKAIKRIHDLPSAKVTPVCHCQDCRYAESFRWCGSLIMRCTQHNHKYIKPDDYCSWGEGNPCIKVPEKDNANNC